MVPDRRSPTRSARWFGRRDPAPAHRGRPERRGAGDGCPAGRPRRRLLVGSLGGARISRRSRRRGRGGEGDEGGAVPGASGEAELGFEVALPVPPGQWQLLAGGRRRIVLDARDGRLGAVGASAHDATRGPGSTGRNHGGRTGAVPQHRGPARALRRPRSPFTRSSDRATFGRTRASLRRHRRARRLADHLPGRRDPRRMHRAGRPRVGAPWSVPTPSLGWER